jgi:ribose 5-phosphate isomerase
VGTGKTVVALVSAIHAILKSEKENIQALTPNPSPKERGEYIEYSQKKYNPEYIIELSRKLRKEQTHVE